MGAILAIFAVVLIISGIKFIAKSFKAANANHAAGEPKDHSAVIEKIALSMIEAGQETGVLPFLSLNEAAEYAKDKSPLFSPDFVQCHAIIGDGYYNLEFRPHPEQGVYMNAYYYGKADEI